MTLLCSMCSPAVILAPLQTPSCLLLDPIPSGLFQSPSHSQSGPLTGPLGASGKRKGRREGRERRPGAGLLTQASVALRSLGSGVGLWASANFPREGVWEFPDTLWQCIRPKKVRKGCKRTSPCGLHTLQPDGFQLQFSSHWGTGGRAPGWGSLAGGEEGRGRLFPCMNNI